MRLFVFRYRHQKRKTCRTNVERFLHGNQNNWCLLIELGIRMIKKTYKKLTKWFTTQCSIPQRIYLARFNCACFKTICKFIRRLFTTLLCDERKRGFTLLLVPKTYSHLVHLLNDVYLFVYKKSSIYGGILLPPMCELFFCRLCQHARYACQHAR